MPFVFFQITMSDTEQLKPIQERFALEYAKSLNGVQAVRTAGYKVQSDNAAAVQASRLLRNAKVHAAVQDAKARIEREAEIDGARVLRELGRIAFADRRQLVSWGPDGVELTPSDALPDDVAAVVSEVQVDANLYGKSIKLKTYDKLGALNTLARHLLPDAPKRLEHTGADGEPLPAPVQQAFNFGALSDEELRQYRDLTRRISGSGQLEQGIGAA